MVKVAVTLQLNGQRQKDKKRDEQRRIGDGSQPRCREGREPIYIQTLESHGLKEKGPSRREQATRGESESCLRRQHDQPRHFKIRKLQADLNAAAAVGFGVEKLFVSDLPHAHTFHLVEQKEQAGNRHTQ